MKILNRYALSRDYSLDNALHCAQLCHLAYPARSESFQQWRVRVFDTLLDAGYQGSICLDQHGTQCFIAEHADYQVVVFRGSEEVHDWLLNLDVGRSETDIHSGFEGALLTVIDSLESVLSDSDKPIYVTGHSLGAALAVILVDYLKREYGFNLFSRVMAVYGYGCPRVGGMLFKERYPLSQATWLHVNNSDVVTRIPLAHPEFILNLISKISFVKEWLPLLNYFPGGYRHVGQCHYFDRFSRYHVQPSWLFRVQDVLLGLSEDLGNPGLDSIKDHYIFSYIHAIQRCRIQ